MTSNELKVTDDKKVKIKNVRLIFFIFM